MNSKSKYLIGLIVVSALYLAFSFGTYKQYGITSDEQVEYEAGRSLLRYLQTGEERANPLIAERHLPTRSTYFRGHLALFSLLNPKAYYEQFHLLNMIFALPIFLMFYSLLFSRYRDNVISGLGTLALFLTPRFLGDIPANPKDVPFAVFFFLSLGFIYLFGKMRVNPFLKIFILGTLFGLTSAFRLLGVSLFVIYLIYTIFVAKSFKIKEALPIFLVAGLVFVRSLPLLSNDMLTGLKVLIESASKFEWDNKMLFMGKFITKEDRPVGYLPVWLFITTPLYVLIPFVLSPVVHFLGKVKDKSLYVLMLLAFGVNFGLYFVINPVIYNGLRHFLFLVPVITFISVITFFDLYPSLSKPKILVMLALVFLAVRSFVSLHPYQYVYFNELAGGLKGAAGRFDSDYWGASYKESSEWVRDNLEREGGANVFACDMAFAVNYYSYNKFRLTGNKEEADFIICDLDNRIQNEFDFPIMHQVVRDGVPINVVMESRKQVFRH